MRSARAKSRISWIFFAVRLDFQGAGHPDQPVQPAQEERAVQVHPETCWKNGELVLFFREGEQRNACLEAVLFLLRRAAERAERICATGGVRPGSRLP